MKKLIINITRWLKKFNDKLNQPIIDFTNIKVDISAPRWIKITAVALLCLVVSVFASEMVAEATNIKQIGALYQIRRYLISEDITITAIPIHVVPPPTKYSTTYQSQPLRIKVIDWIKVQIEWPRISGATSYMLRVGSDVYPASINMGNLVYEGASTRTLDQRISNARYTLFYTNSSGEWVISSRGHIGGN